MPERLQRGDQPEPMNCEDERFCGVCRHLGYAHRSFGSVIIKYLKSTNVNFSSAILILLNRLLRERAGHSS